MSNCEKRLEQHEASKRASDARHFGVQPLLTQLCFCFFPPASCDFGSAKCLVKGEPNVAYICSRYYRAPELVFEATEYTTSIDTWSIGSATT